MHERELLVFVSAGQIALAVGRGVELACTSWDAEAGINTTHS